LNPKSPMRIHPNNLVPSKEFTILDNIIPVVIRNHLQHKYQALWWGQDIWTESENQNCSLEVNREYRLQETSPILNTKIHELEQIKGHQINWFQTYRWYKITRLSHYLTHNYRSRCNIQIHLNLYTIRMMNLNLMKELT